MGKRTQFVILILILLIAAFLRLSSVDWDEYNNYHPDERYIAWVATSIEWPEEWQTAFQPEESTFNPFYWPPGASSEGLVLEQDEPRRFAYGHLPLYLGVAATRLAEGIGPLLTTRLPEAWLLTSDILNGAGQIEFRHLTAVGRVLTALFDLATVSLVFLLGKWLFSPSVGLLAAALLAVNVMHIQLAHFFTVDPYLTLFVVVTIVLLVAATRGNSDRNWRTGAILLAGATIGLAVGSKFGGTLLVLPLAVAVALQVQWSTGRRVAMLAAAVAIGLFVFALTNPFAILDVSCESGAALHIGPVKVPEQLQNSCYLQNIVSQGTMVRGTRDVPYVRQYAGTTPYLYFVEMQVRWGMGPLLGLVSFAGLVWAVWRALRLAVSWWRAGRSTVTMLESYQLGQERFPFTQGELVVLLWTVPFFLTTGALAVKFMRYLQPLTPFLMLYSAAMILSIRIKTVRRVSAALLLIVTGLYALAFLNMYRQPHPWVAASKWLYDQAAPGSLILSEMWDDRLPDNLTVDGQDLRRGIFQLGDVNWLSGTESHDSLEKLNWNLALVAESDYLALASNRNYGVIPRLPERYPLSSQFYRLLFDGQLGFEVAYVGTRMPNLLGLHLTPDSFRWPDLGAPIEVEQYLAEQSGLAMGRFDESFTVYDQPLVIIFRNTGRLSAEQLSERFQVQ
ncbi:MAG: phospholipid carrier-dependent glycosyltransferase [Chloroflexota bacterium]|nr:MAG: phospholipid carrier-dependent glycosyltransferase [Chloroflexota bacterium]